MALSKLVKKAIKDSEVKEDNLATGVATTAKFGPDAVESSEIGNGTVTADDLASTLDLSSKSVTLPTSSVNFDREYFNISLLGFKMAVNENLTVFNLVDGVVDEFHDESGTDEAEGSNDTYCASGDFYCNQLSACLSAGFSMTAVTEGDTSTAGTNPKHGTGSPGTFAKTGAGIFNLTINTWGSGGAGGYAGPADGGGGGFATGTYNNYEGETLYIMSGEGGGSYGCSPVCGVNRKNISAIGGDHPLAPGPYGASPGPSAPITSGNRGGGGKGEHAGGGGLAYVGTAVVDQENAPNIIMIGGAGGGGGGEGGPGGAGGGSSGQDGTGPGAAEGGSQTAGGTKGPGSPAGAQDGGFLYGGNGDAPQNGGGGGAGYYGGGGGGFSPSPHGAGGGGSSYFGHPQVTSGSTEGGNNAEGGGTADPNYQSSTNEGGGTQTAGEDGYVLITGSFNVAQNTTIVSNAFASGSVPTSSRIVVFQENIDTPTLNTDIIASISRDGGSNFTTATLSDSGYVTGSSGQRILTGQATISGQPSGQSMRWKLALANNKVKIHGVSLSWA